MRRFLFVMLGLLIVPAYLHAQIPEGADIRAIFSEIYITDDMLLNAGSDPDNWLLYGRTYANPRYSPLKQINRHNVKDLVVKWAFSFGVLEGQDSQAIVYNGRIWVTTSFNRVYSLDGETGSVIWSYKRDLPADVFPHLCCDVNNKGLAIYRDKGYLGTLDAHIVALDLATGEVVWDVQTGDYKASESHTGMPLAVDGKIITGTAGAEYGVRGWIVALDAETGEELWRIWTIAGPDGPVLESTGKVYPDWKKSWSGDSWKLGGGSQWTGISYDPELHAIFVPTGNPGPDFDGESRLGDNLFSNSTMVLNPDNGLLKYWFQYTPHDNWDYDGVNEVILADIDGRKVWLHGDRNGFLYSIDRTNGQCIWAEPLSEINWMTGFGPNCTPIVNPEFDPEVQGYDKVTMNIHPSLDGGKEWHPMSYSERTNLIYVPTYNYGMDLQPLQQQWERGEWYLGAMVIRITDGNGALRAHDASTGKLVWSNVYQYPMTSGVVSTAGGLVFYGDPTGMFHAVNDETGEELWSFQTGTGVHGSPTSWAINGTQYVGAVVGAGGGGLWPLHYGEWLKNHTKGGALFVFALHN